MSVYSEPASSVLRAADFSFCFDSPSFSDCIIVLTTRQDAAPGVYKQLLGSAARLALATVQLTADKMAGVNDTAAGKVANVSSWLGSSSLLSSRNQANPNNQIVVTHTLRVNSAVLAAASPYLKQLVLHLPAAHCRAVTAAAQLASRAHGGSSSSSPQRVMALIFPGNRTTAAAAVIKYIFTRSLEIKDVYDALDLLVVAEQLQVHEAAAECLQYLDCRPMDWPLCLSLLQLEHQLQQQQRQARNAAAAHQGWSTTQQHTGQQQQQQAKGALLSLWPLQQQQQHPQQPSEPLELPLPLPSSSAGLYGLLQQARQHLLSEFEDFEALWATAEGRERFLALPLPAVAALLEQPGLLVASENTALLAAACWLQEQQQSRPAAAAAAVANRAPATTASCSGGDQEAAAGTAQSLEASVPVEQSVAAKPANSHEATAVASDAEELLGRLRIAHLSYTYLLHVLPILPAFQGCKERVQQLQQQALWYRAASSDRQQYIAAAAAAAAALHGSVPTCDSTSTSASSLVAEVHLHGTSAAQASSKGPTSAAGGGSAYSPSCKLGMPADRSSVCSDLCTGLDVLQHLHLQHEQQQQELAAQEQQRVTMYSRRPRSMPDGYQFKVHLSLADLDATTSSNSNSSSQHSSSSSSSMHKLLGGGASPSSCCTLPDQWYCGYKWNMVVAADGFVGLMWQLSTDARQGQQLLQPSPEAEVGVMFSIWVEPAAAGAPSAPADASGGRQAGSCTPAAASRRGGNAGSVIAERQNMRAIERDAVAAAGQAAACSQAGSRPAAEDQLPQLRALHHQQQQLLSSCSDGGGGARQQPLCSYGAGAFTTPQYIPAGCACGFSQLLGPELELLRAGKGSLTLLCKLQLCD